eukprot:1159548-Pelagomonas_calceolata.AAC.3
MDNLTGNSVVRRADSGSGRARSGLSNSEKSKRVVGGADSRAGIADCPKQTPPLSCTQPTIIAHSCWGTRFANDARGCWRLAPVHSLRAVRCVRSQAGRGGKSVKFVQRCATQEQTYLTLKG